MLNSLVQVSVESGGRFPVFSPAGFAFVRLTNVTNGVRTEAPVNASTIRLTSSVGEYRVSIENLPAGYGVKAIMADGADITRGTLKVASSNFPTLALVNTGGLFIFSSSSAGMTASINLSIILTAQAAAQPARTGLLVTGRAKDTYRRSIYISGQPGIFYTDGTFEFRGVPPGQHAIVTLVNPESGKPLVASIVVGNRDVEGVELSETSTLPPGVQSMTAPLPAGTYAPGPVPLASLHVAVIDEASRQPAAPGTVYILGGYGTSFDLPENGRFDLSRLLPGEYKFEIQPFGHASITKSVVIGNDDVTLELAVQ